MSSKTASLNAEASKIIENSHLMTKSRLAAIVGAIAIVIAIVVADSRQYALVLWSKDICSRGIKIKRKTTFLTASLHRTLQ